MLRRSLVLALLLASSTTLAETPPATPPAAAPPAAAPPAAAPPADGKKADAKKDDKKPAEAPATPAVPALPPPAEATPTPTPPEATPAPAMSPEDLAKLKAQLKAELETELKAQMQNEMEAAARESATQKAANQEWEEEKWVEEVKPTLNFLQLDGYFRTRFDLMSRLDLGTFDPNAAGGQGKGTSEVPPPTFYTPFNGTNCVPTGANATPNFPGPNGACSTTASDDHTLLSTNMRLRLDPTLNVSDDLKIRSTVDVFDDLVYGATPGSLPGFAVGNPQLPLPVFTTSQNPVQAGLNFMWDAIRVKRLWAEVTTPLGQLRFGRMPLHFGLGVMLNDGNKLNSDYGDSADQIMFATRIAGLYIVPAYSYSASGPFARGGGSGAAGDAGGIEYLANEQGQRYNLDPHDDVHTFLLVIAKKDKEEDITEQLRNGGIVLNYGVFAAYRTQQFDDPAYYSTPVTPFGPNPAANPADYVRRDANAGIGSAWARFQWDKLKVEAEVDGIVGLVNGTAVVSGSGNFDPRLRTVDPANNGRLKDNPLWVLQGGGALESSYKLLNDQLTVGLDGGIASGDDAFGFGLRPVLNQNPKPGDTDGLQYGQCLQRDPNGGDRDGDGQIDCTKVDSDITNFKFNPDYQVDLILFREVLGTVTNAFYVKPHVGYNLTENLGARVDVIYSEALLASGTPGLQNPLGLEIDGTGYYGTEDGFYLMAQYGFLLPFGGLSHWSEDTTVATEFKTAQFAQRFQVFGGIQF